MAARTNSSIIFDQGKALSVGITAQRGGLTRINNAVDNATISQLLSYTNSNHDLACSVQHLHKLLALPHQLVVVVVLAWSIMDRL